MRNFFAIAAFTMLLVTILISFVSANNIEQTSLNYVSHAEKIADFVPKTNQADHYQEIVKKRLIGALNAYFKNAIYKKQMVGAAVGIVKCDSILYLGGFGRKNIKFKEPIDKQTIFRIGSLSKGFAGVLAGIEVEKGSLNWDDKVADYIPSFKVKGVNRTNQITLSTILSHSSGVPYHSFTNLVEDGLPLKDIASQFDQLIPVAEPGQIYSYQNAIYALSGEMIAVSGKKTIGELMKEKIFDPLGMTSASTDYSSLINATNVATPHKRNYRGWRTRKINSKYYNAIAAGGVNASITDMAKWMRFLLGHNQEVLSTATLNEVFNPTIKIDGRNKYYQKWPGHVSSHYGYGWRIHSFEDNFSDRLSRIFHHGGTVSNYRSEIAIYPDEDLGICVLFNSPTKIARNVVPDLRKIVKEIMNTTPRELEQGDKPAIL